MDIGPKITLAAKDGYGKLRPAFNFSLNLPGPVGDSIELSQYGYPWNKSHIQTGYDLSKGSVVWMLGPLHGQVFIKKYDWKKELPF